MDREREREKKKVCFPHLKIIFKKTKTNFNFFLFFQTLFSHPSSTGSTSWATSSTPASTPSVEHNNNNNNLNSKPPSHSSPPQHSLSHNSPPKPEARQEVPPVETSKMCDWETVLLYPKTNNLD